MNKDACPGCRSLWAELQDAKEKLAKIQSAVCSTCSGSGEFGLVDDTIPCLTCGGSGDPTKPGLFARIKPGNEAEPKP